MKNGNLLFAHNHTDSVQSGVYNWNRITLTKLNINGNIIWRKSYGMSEKNASVSKVKECFNGDFVMCGQKTHYYNSTASQLTGWLMRTDSMGNLKWWYAYLPNDPIKDTIADNYLLDVQQLPDGSFAAVGQANGSSQFGTVLQTWLLVVDSNGCYQNGCAQPVGIEEYQANNNNVVSRFFRILLRMKLISGTNLIIMIKLRCN